MKPVSGRCNLDCKYCFYKENDYGPMQMRVVRAVVNSDPAVVGWQGGEPTLVGLQWFRAAIETFPTTTQHTLMTNGILLDNNWVKFLRDHNFLVGVSIDGTEKMHNANRAEWAKTVDAIQLLLEHEIPTNAVVTVNRANWNHGVKVYRTLVKMGVKYLQFIPVVVDEKHNCGITGYEWGTFLVDVFSEWLENGLGWVSIQLFEEIARNVIGESSTLCVHCESCGGFVVEATGAVFCCEHFVGAWVEHLNRSAYLGNVIETPLHEMGESSVFKNFNNLKSLSACQDCEHRHLCYSGCIRHRAMNGRENLLCAGYKNFFERFLEEVVPLR